MRENKGTIRLKDSQETPNPFAPFLHLHKKAARESAKITEKEADYWWEKNTKDLKTGDLVTYINPRTGKEFTI